jgi:hypothetical protein
LVIHFVQEMIPTVKTKPFMILLTVICLLALSACASPDRSVPTPLVNPSETLTQASTTAIPSSTIPVLASVDDYKPQSSCDHPYLPLRSGASWTLSTADVVMNLTVSELTLAQPETVAMMMRAYDFGDRYTQAWRCGEAGIYENDVLFYTADEGVVRPVVTISHTGFYLPKASLLSPGYRWDEFSAIEHQGTVISSTYHYQVLSTNPVTVTGQVYPGLQVTIKETVVVLSKDGQESQQEVSLLRVFALGVGIVQENDLILRKVIMPQ